MNNILKLNAQMMKEDNVVDILDINNIDLIRNLLHDSSCSFEPARVTKVTGVTFGVATNGIENKNMYIHFPSGIYEFYVLLRTKEDYNILKNNVLKEKLKS